MPLACEGRFLRPGTRHVSCRTHRLSLRMPHSVVPLIHTALSAECGKGRSLPPGGLQFQGVQFHRQHPERAAGPDEVRKGKIPGNPLAPGPRYQFPRAPAPASPDSSSFPLKAALELPFLDSGQPGQPWETEASLVTQASGHP